MSHAHAHDHEVIHGPRGAKASHALWWCVAITAGFAGVEAAAGGWSGSLALVSDAGHMLMDAVSLSLAALAAWLGARGAQGRRTFGWAKAESLAGFISAALMLVLIGWIVWKAVARLQASQTEPIEGGWVMGVGALGLGVNLLVAWVLSRSEKSLSVKAALLHTVADAMGSIGAMAAGWGVSRGWTWADPAVSIAIAALITKGSVDLIRETAEHLMDIAPLQWDPDQMKSMLSKVHGVERIEDFHIWMLSPSEPSLSAHVRLRPGARWESVIQEMTEMARSELRIRHCTIQPIAPKPDEERSL